MEVDLDKMAERVAEKALDEFTYNGKTIREWVEIIVAQDLLAITELEKIKKKIKNECILNELWFIDTDDLRECLGRIDAIVDKRIEELKGENNESNL